MKKNVFATMFVVACLFCVSGLSYGQTPPADVVQAAESGLMPYLQKIPAPELEQFGFAPGEDLGEATLGAPYQLHTITPDALEQYRSSTPVGSIISPTTMWYFPVQIRGQTKAILVVDRLDNQWQAVSLGYAGLAGELDLMSRHWNSGAGYNPVLVVVFQARQYLFTVPEKGADNLTPLTPAKQAAVRGAAADYTVLKSASSTIGQMKPIVRQNIK